MKVKQIEALYYQFELQKGFIPKTILTDDNINKTMAMRYATRQLCDFINEHIIVYNTKIPNKRLTTDVDHEKMTLITKNKKEYNNVKEFCNYLLDSDELLNLTIDCFINAKIKFVEFNEGLDKSFKTYEYLKFEKEISINDNKEKKKLKL